VHPEAVKWLEWENMFSYMYTWLPHQTDSTDHLPWIPAPHWNSNLIFRLNDRKGSALRSTYFRAGISTYWAQNDIYSALYTELASAPYTMVNAGLGTNLVGPRSGRVICSLFVNCTNLTNIAYADHLNLAQYFYAVNGNLVTVTHQRQGVYNMGRDVSVKVVFPFGSK